MSDLFARIRAASAEVMARARHVRLLPGGVEALADELVRRRPAPPAWDEETHFRGAPGATLAYVLVLDTLNFGSGWFPWLRKPAGRSGYFTLALALRRRFLEHGPWTAAELQRMAPADLAALLGQDPAHPELTELFALQARALRELGELVEGRHGGRFEGVVEAAAGSAEALVHELLRMPLFRDVARYGALEVPFLKRAQITVADLALAFEGRGPGRFHDLDALTAFADNLVPHVLRHAGALGYAPALAARIERGELLPPGSPEEVEIRAACVQGVERVREALAARGLEVPSRVVDFWLWHRGQRPEVKAHPRHRTRTAAY